MVNCPYHNLQHLAFTSPYIQGLILSNSTITENIFFVKIYIEIMGKWAHFWADSEFLLNNKIAIPSEDRSIIVIDTNLEDEEKNFNIYTNTVPVCIKCYDDFVALNNIGHIPIV